MFLQKISFEILAENFIVAFMQSDTMIVDQAEGVDLTMKFFILFRLVEFKTKSFHSKTPP